MREAFKTIEKQSDVYDAHQKPLFCQALERFGILERDEMYAFVHPLYLGGENLVENMQKTNLFIYADIQKNIETPPVIRI
jgi:hypothetical protein